MNISTNNKNIIIVKENNLTAKANIESNMEKILTANGMITVINTA